VNSSVVKLKSREWWWEYLEILFSPRQVLNSIINVKVHAYDVALPFIFVVSVSFFMNLWIFSNPNIVERFLTADEAYYTTNEEVERAESNLESVQRAMDTPGTAMVVAFAGGTYAARTIIIFLIVLFTVISGLSRKWYLLEKFIVVSSIASSVLFFGALVNYAGRVFFGRLISPLSIAFLIRPYDDARFADFALSRTDFFTLWYITLLSIGVSHVYGMRFRTVTIVILLCWIMLLSLSYLAHFEFSLGI
jgi:hypothetical protein